MKRPLLILIVAGSLACASVASAAPTQIQVDDDFYAPANPAARNLASGASFQWQRALGSTRPHNVRQDFVLFNSGGTTSGPINFSVQASAGTYHYYCSLHGTPNPGGGGMAGLVKVRPVMAGAPTGLPFTVSWALSGTTTGNRFDIRFRVGTSGAWTLWKNDAAARSGVFGQGGQPVQVIANRTYQFQARSLRSTALNKTSGWSPTLIVNT